MFISKEFCWCIIITSILGSRACGFSTTTTGKSESSSHSLVTLTPGSKPPSCLNKCDSCTPCQAVQTIGNDREVITDIGSRPPSCQNKCNRCLPCQPVQVPTPDPKERPVPQGDVSSQYSNYKPKGWRCQCGNKLFNP